MKNTTRSNPSVTTVPISPEADRARRMRSYLISMSIRTVCILMCLVIPFPWLILPAIGAIFLPYIAVVSANTATTMPGTMVNPHIRHLTR